MHPSLASQVSEVHALPSSQFSGVPTLQIPEPSHVSAPLHTVASAQDVCDGWKASVGQVALEPVQYSATSQSPAAALQTIVDGANVSAGQAALEPVHDSATSHASPVEALQTVVAGIKLLTHCPDWQLSCASQGPCGKPLQEISFALFLVLPVSAHLLPVTIYPAQLNGLEGSHPKSLVSYRTCSFSVQSLVETHCVVAV